MQKLRARFALKIYFDWKYFQIKKKQYKGTKIKLRYATCPIIALYTKKPLNIKTVAPSREMYFSVLKCFFNKKNIPRYPSKEK